MRGRLRLRQLALLALVVFSIVGLTAACTSTSTSMPHREIEAVGVVGSVGGSKSGTDMVDTYTFDDGRTYSMHFKGGRSIQGGGVLPHVGDLLIAGSRPDNWMLVATPRTLSEGFPSGCFGLGSQAGYDRDTTVELDFGVTLQKSPDYNSSGHKPQAHFDGLGVICLDRQGRVKLIN